MKFTHFSRHAKMDLKPRDQIADYHYDKPEGLWLSVDGPDNWYEVGRQWFEEEDFAYQFSVELNEGPLILDTVEKVLEFNKNYGIKNWLGTTVVDWLRVSKDYPGIVIAPYQWSLRRNLELNWYYSWDCASGCIWDPTAIKDIRPLTPGAEVVKTNLALVPNNPYFNIRECPIWAIPQLAELKRRLSNDGEKEVMFLSFKVIESTNGIQTGRFVVDVFGEDCFYGLLYAHRMNDYEHPVLASVFS